jgi:hypothetical protein
LQRENLWSRLFVIVAPALVYGVWYLGWGHTAESALSFGNALGAPEHIARSFSLTATEMTGLSKVISPSEVLPSLFVGLFALSAVAWGVSRQKGIPQPLVVAAVIALAFWGLAALNVAPGRSFEVSRYQFPNAVFLLMIVAGAFEGARPRAGVLAILGLVAAAAVAVNIKALESGYERHFKPLSDKGIAGLTALDIARGSVNPELAVGMNLDDSAMVAAGDYFAAEDRYGSPAWSNAEILESSDFARTRIDEILVAALPLSARPLPAERESRSCQAVEAGGLGSAEEITLPARRITFRSQEGVFLGVSRYGDRVATGVAFAESGTEMMLHVPADSSNVPWRIAFFGSGNVRVCSTVE